MSSKLLYWLADRFSSECMLFREETWNIYAEAMKNKEFTLDTRHNFMNRLMEVMDETSDLIGLGYDIGSAVQDETDGNLPTYIKDLITSCAKVSELISNDDFKNGVGKISIQRIWYDYWELMVIRMSCITACGNVGKEEDETLTKLRKELSQTEKKNV